MQSKEPPNTRIAILAIAVVACAALSWRSMHAQATTQSTTPVAGQAQYFSAADMEKAYPKNAVLVEDKDSYRVSTGQRDKAGEAEVHAEMTDIFYIVDGSATFVTGGKVVSPRSTGPGETRGTSIDGGETRTLAKGDVIVIPAGTPHWFKAVPGTFRNVIVKVKKK